MKNKVRKADENLKLSIELQMQGVADARIDSRKNYLLYSIGVETTDPHLNGVLCLNDHAADEIIRKAASFFEDTNLDYTFWVRDHADFKLEELLQQKGLVPNRMPGSAVMAIDKRVKKSTLPTGFEVKRVVQKDHIDDFGKVIEQAFDKTPELIEKMFETEETLIHNQVISHVIYEGKKPVAAVMTVLSGDTAGIYWVGTVTDSRGQGLGSFATQIATNAGFDQGAKLIILQASELGERIYRKLGYKIITRYRTYTIKNNNVR